MKRPAIIGKRDILIGKLGANEVEFFSRTVKRRVPLAEICGYVERITFQNAQTGYVVIKVQEYTKKQTRHCHRHYPLDPGG